MLTLLLPQFTAVVHDTNNDAMSDLLHNLQRILEYCVEGNSDLREVLEQ